MSEKSPFFPLSLLPPEVLGNVAFGVNGHLALELWKCGNTELNKKLAFGVTNIDLMDVNWTSTSRYPKLLSRFTRLQSLKIHREMCPLMRNARELSFELQKLPPTLVHLSLIIRDAAASIQLYPADDHDGSKEPSALNQAIISEYPRGPSKLFNFEELFPRLETFELKREETFCSLSFSDLACGLPSSLTVYNQVSSMTSASSSHNADLKCLPRNLRVWGGNIIIQGTTEEQTRENWSHAPPSLTEVNFIRYPAAMPDFSFLPRSLTKAEFIIRPIRHPDIFASLPPLLRKLDLSYVEFDPASFSAHTTHWAAFLPNKLETLSLLPPLDFATVSNLPRSLTFLSCQNVLWSTFEQVAVDTTDPVLSNEDKEVPNTKMDCDECTHTWPPNLQVLHHTGDIHALKYLPLSLKELGMFLPPNLPPDIELDCSLLPRSLEFICLAGATTSFIGSLPPQLTKLDAKQSKLENLTSPLPSGLTSLTIDYIPRSTLEESPSSLIHPLPHNLTSLTVQSMWWDQFISLPSGLVQLDICEIKGYKKSMDCENKDLFEDLPLGLKYLRIEKASSLSDQLTDLSELSCRNLTRLISLYLLPFEGVHSLPGSWLKTASKMAQLKVLLVRMHTATPEELAYFPKTLKDCHLIGLSNSEMGAVWPLVGATPGNHNEVFNNRMSAARANMHLYPDPRVSTRLLNSP